MNDKIPSREELSSKDVKFLRKMAKELKSNSKQNQTQLTTKPKILAWNIHYLCKNRLF